MVAAGRNRENPPIFMEEPGTRGETFRVVRDRRDVDLAGGSMRFADLSRDQATLLDRVGLLVEDLDGDGTSIFAARSSSEHTQRPDDAAALPNHFAHVVRVNAELVDHLLPVPLGLGDLDRVRVVDEPWDHVIEQLTRSH